MESSNPKINTTANVSPIMGDYNEVEIMFTDQRAQSDNSIIIRIHSSDLSTVNLIGEATKMYDKYRKK